MSSIATAPEPAPSRPPSGTEPRRRNLTGSDAFLGLVLAALLVLLAVKTTAGADLGSTWGEIVLVLAGAAVAIAVIVLGTRGRAGAGTAAVGLFALLTAFTAASILWSIRPDESWLASNQALAYLATFAGGAGLARLLPGRWPALLWGLAAATAALSAYALLVKVFPSLDTTDTLGRLQAPFGYWNATGLCAALGLAPWLWAGSRRDAHRLTRAGAVPAVAVTVTVVVLSYSRSAALAAIVGAAVWFSFVPLRLRGVLVLALGGAGAAIASAYYLSQSALTTDNVATAARAGAAHRFGILLAVVLLGLGAAGWAAARAHERRSLTARRRRQIGTALIAAVALVPVVGIAGLAASSRGLTGEISHAWSTLTNPKAKVGDTAGRLVQFGNSRSQYWREGIKVGDQEPLRGVGALAFGTARTRYATTPLVAQNAHSYAIETYADLGLIGVAISLALLVAWAVAGRRAVGAGSRGRLRSDAWGERIGLLTLVAMIVAYGVQSAIDWTWFIPGVTAPALLAAGWLAGRGALERPVRPAAKGAKLIDRPGTAALAALVAAVALLAAWVVYQPLRAANAGASAFTALRQGSSGQAFADARTAVNIDPLAVDPLFELSALYAGSGDAAAARAELRKAIRLQPENFNTWLQLGLLELQEHQPQAAIVALTEAHTLNPPLVATQSALAQAQREAAGK